jgi:DNA-binding XRE family transcriptional regulator
MVIKIIYNNIEDLINQYCNKTGATKVWIAKQLDMSSSRMYQLYRATNMNVDVALKFAEFLNCDVKDLFEYEVIK